MYFLVCEGVNHLDVAGPAMAFANAHTAAPKRGDLARRTLPAPHHNAHTLTRMAGVSVRQLTHLFETELGTTPARYIEQMRFDTANGLGLGGEYSPPRLECRLGPIRHASQRPRRPSFGLASRRVRDRLKLARLCQFEHFAARKNMTVKMGKKGATTVTRDCCRNVTFG